METTIITHFLPLIVIICIPAVFLIWLVIWWANTWMTNTQMAVLALDILLYVHHLRLMLDLLFILLQSLYLFSNLACWTLQDLHNQIGHCLSTVSWKPTVPLARHSSHYFLNHHRTSRMIVQLDQYFTSSALFSAVLMNIVFNVYSLSTFMLRSDSVQ